MVYESEEFEADDGLLEAAESGDLILAAILNGDFGIMSESELDTLYAELHLMDAIAIKRAGGEHLVHWEVSGDYN